MARLTIEQWNRKIARMIENIDHPSVLRDLIEALGEGMYFDNWYCVFFRRDAPPIEVDHSAVEVRRERYISGPYLLDPFYTSFLEGIEAGCYTMRELGVPPDFKESRYYTEYYSPWGAGDEMGYILPVSDDISAHLSMARREPQSLSPWRGGLRSNAVHCQGGARHALAVPSPSSPSLHHPPRRRARARAVAPPRCSPRGSRCAALRSAAASGPRSTRWGPTSSGASRRRARTWTCWRRRSASRPRPGRWRPRSTS